MTFLDGFFQDVLQRKGVDINTIANIFYFMKEQKYDTDALKEDITGITDQQTLSTTTSNIFCICNGNNEFISAITHFATYVNCMQAKFSPFLL